MLDFLVGECGNDKIECRRVFEVFMFDVTCKDSGVTRNGHSWS